MLTDQQDSPLYLMMPVYLSGRGVSAARSSVIVTGDPKAAFKRYWNDYAARWAAAYPQLDPLDKLHTMFAVWPVAERMSRKEAKRYTAKNPPHRVYLNSEYRCWDFVELMLPPGRLVEPVIFPNEE